MKAFKYLFLFLIIIILLLAACDKDAGVTTEEENPQPEERDAAAEEEISSPEDGDVTEEEIPSLKEFFKDDFYIGVAVEASQLEIPAQRELILKHFSSITAENAMKPEEIQPVEGVFDFRDADKIVEFGQENGIPVRGHTLIWHNQVPD